MQTFERTSEFDAPVSALRALHDRPLAFERMQPPWDALTPSAPTTALRAGDELSFATNFGPIPLSWRAKIVSKGDDGFVDEQLTGPFASWRHTHIFESLGATRCRLTDRIEYALPRVPLANAIAGETVRQRLARTFRFRHATVGHDLALGIALDAQPHTVLVTGASGLIGSQVLPLLSTMGHRVVRAVRRAARGDDEATWDVASGAVTLAPGTRIDAVLHLAGENIAGARLTPAQRARVRDSRIGATQRLIVGLVPHAPRTFVCASAVGFYGDGGDASLSESAPQGAGFLAEVSGEWEAAAHTASAHGMRVVCARIGIVLSPQGGALAKVLPVFAAGAGGVLADGAFYQPHVSVDDVGGMLVRMLLDARASGAVNAVSCEAVTNREFTRVLGAVLKRPTMIPVPRALLRLALGAIVDEGLLASARVQPTALAALGHTFRHKTTADALAHVLGLDPLP